MKRSTVRVLLGAMTCMGVLFAAPPRAAHAVPKTCILMGQQAGSFIGGGPGVPFTVQSSGKDNCTGLLSTDSTSMVTANFVGGNTTNCPGALVAEYSLSGSFTTVKANSGVPTKGTPSTSIHGTFTSGFVCLDSSVTPTATHGSLTGTVTGGSGTWAGASGTITMVSTGLLLATDPSGNSQQFFNGTLTGTIQHP